MCRSLYPDTIFFLLWKCEIIKNDKQAIRLTPVYARHDLVLFELKEKMKTLFMPITYALQGSIKLSSTTYNSDRARSNGVNLPKR